MSNAMIAVVDDNRETLELVDLILTDEGYQTILLPEGQNAYQLIRSQQPDLVILDLRMEDPREGWITLDLLRADPMTATIPVIMSSCDHEFLHAHAAVLRAENCGVLPKPFRTERLLDMVAEALASRSPAADGANAITAIVLVA